MLKKKFLSFRGNNSYQDINYSCVVRFLDNNEPITVSIQKDTSGQHLIDHVCSHLNLAERAFFGLRYVDSEKQRHWLDYKKTVYRQLKNISPMVLCFRVKYYPSDPMKLKEEITRYFLFLQLERDLTHNRLFCTTDISSQLNAYLLKAKYEDFDLTKSSENAQILKSISKSAQPEQIFNLYENLAGMTVTEAENNFLKLASTLESYGVDPHPVKDDIDGSGMYLGVTHIGIITFQGNKMTRMYNWSDITKLDFVAKKFIINLAIPETSGLIGYSRKKKSSVAFKCPSGSACRHLWKCAVEQQFFFTLNSTNKINKVKANNGLFKKSLTYKFNGSCETEVWASSYSLTRNEPIFTRSVSISQFDRNKVGYDTLPSSYKYRAVKDDVPDDGEVFTKASINPLDQSILSLESSKTDSFFGSSNEKYNLKQNASSMDAQFNVSLISSICEEVDEVNEIKDNNIPVKENTDSNGFKNNCDDLLDGSNLEEIKDLNIIRDSDNKNKSYIEESNLTDFKESIKRYDQLNLPGFNTDEDWRQPYHGSTEDSKKVKFAELMKKDIFDNPDFIFNSENIDSLSSNNQRNDDEDGEISNSNTRLFNGITKESKIDGKNIVKNQKTGYSICNTFLIRIINLLIFVLFIAFIYSVVFYEKSKDLFLNKAWLKELLPIIDYFRSQYYLPLKSFVAPYIESLQKSLPGS